MNDHQSDSRRASDNAFERALEQLGDLLQPLEDDEEVSIPTEPDSEQDPVWDEVGADLEAFFQEEEKKE